MAPEPTESTPVATYPDRLTRLAELAGVSGADVVLITPGPDLAYFIGHSIGSHERLTCLVVPAERRPVAAGADPGAAGLVGFAGRVDGCRDQHLDRRTGPVCRARRAAAGRRPGAVGGLPHARGARPERAGDRPRVRADAGRARRSPSCGCARAPTRSRPWLPPGRRSTGCSAGSANGCDPGRTENEVAADIAAAIVAEGHERPDFVIVGSGPNGASPHHEASDRVIEPGDVVVIDIGGPMPSGYFSDCTRTYLVAGGAVPTRVRRCTRWCDAPQAAGVAAVRPGVTAESIDAAARTVIDDAGFGEYFITRTGHGIGLEVHEHPYLVSGNTITLEAGMAFSVEPGIYLPGEFGVRIEDIVVVGESGAG